MSGKTEGNKRKGSEVGDKRGGGVERRAEEEPTTGNRRLRIKEICGSTL
jgi:hypothetical protein